jgi:hypothetical protein
MANYHFPTFLLLVLIALTVHRFARLVTRDTILDGPRNWITRRYHGSLIELLSCMWCVSVWIAAVVIVLTLYGPAWWPWVMVGAAASSTAGLLGDWE